MHFESKVSIILPTYKGGKYIKRSIESVLSQSFSDWELIIIDDGSIDNTKEIIKPYLENEKIVYFFQNNAGQANARNRGILMSKGIYVAFIDDDDEWVDKDKIKDQIEFLDNNSEYALVGTNGVIIKENGDKIMDYSVPENDSSIRKNILLKNPFIQSSVVVRRDILNKAGNFLLKENKNAEDYNLWLRVGLLGKFCNLQKPMTCYMLREGNTSLNNKKSILKSNILFIKEFRGKYPNSGKALFFAYIKFYIYSMLQIVSNKKIRSKIIMFLFKRYRN